jgi:predicted Zn-dependent protease
MARGDVAGAAASLKPLAADASRPVMLVSAELALAGAGGEAAIKRSAEDLQTRVAAKPGEVLAWSLLSRIWAKLNQPLRSLRAEGEAQYAMGDLRGAIDRLRAGQRLAQGGGATDFIESSVIDSRLRDLQAQQRALAAEERESR